MEIWVYVADIADELILGLDILHAYDASVDLGRQMLRLEPQPSRLIVAHDQVIPAQCERVVMAQLESPLGVENGLIEPSPEAQVPEGLYIARTLVRDQREVPVRVLKVTLRDQKLAKGFPVARCEPVALVTQPDAAAPQDQATSQNLQDMIEAARPNLGAEEIRELEDLVTEYEDVFAMQSGDYGRTNRVYHRMNIGEARPIRQPPRRLLAKRAEATDLLENMRRRGVIEESDSPWSSPVVLVRKKNGDLRFCVDYRKVNDVTRKDYFPMPRIDDTLGTLAGAKWFSTLDLKSCYWQVDLHPDKEKTAFSTGQGLWKFTVMPFDLWNAPATFERLMETVLRSLAGESCLVYLDDVIVIGRSFQEHLLNLRNCSNGSVMPT
jgi:hypothetical protein